MRPERAAAAALMDEKTAREYRAVPISLQKNDQGADLLVIAVLENDEQIARRVARFVKIRALRMRVVSHDNLEAEFAESYPRNGNGKSDGYLDALANRDSSRTNNSVTENPSSEASARKNTESENAYLAECNKLAEIERTAIATRTPEKQLSDMREAGQYIVGDFAYSSEIAPIRFDSPTATLYVSATKNTLQLTNIVRAEARVKVILLVRDVKNIRKDQKLIYDLGFDASQSDASANLEAILSEAIRLHAADVLIEPIGESAWAQVRFAVDGKLQLSSTYRRFDWASAQRIITLIREQGKVSPNEDRRPGDGRLTRDLQGRKNDLRISTIPTSGDRQRVVMRFLNTTLNLRGMTDLGMRPDTLEIFARCARRPGGFMTIAGPTGAGKTTTAYALIKEFFDLVRENICSLENPIECFIPGFIQIQVDADAESAKGTGQMTFAAALKAMLRQFPSRVFLGEIRDEETLKEAMRAATTGISLLATIHTDDALKTMARLKNFGASKFEISQSLTAATSQRLIKKLCPDCKIETDIVSDEVIEIAQAYGIDRKNRRVFGPSPIGCRTCNNTSYRDRIGAFEILEMNPEVQSVIEMKQGLSVLGSVAVSTGYRPMVVNAIENLLDGLTSEEMIKEQLPYDTALRYRKEAANYTASRKPKIESQITVEDPEETSTGDDDVLKF